MDKVFIWLDDERPINTNWKHYCKEFGVDFVEIKTAEACADFLQHCKDTNKKVFISFDHDLGLGMNGYLLAQWIVEYKIPIVGFTVHSMNPVGAKNIRELLTHCGYYLMKARAEISSL